jgi:hypothetical protein
MPTREFPPVARVPVRTPPQRVHHRFAPTSRTAVAVAGAVFVAVLVTHLVDFGADSLHVSLFNADSDGSWSHVLSATTLAALALTALVGLVRGAQQRALWAAAVAILGFLAVAEISSLHARIDAMSWGKLVYAPALLVLCLCVWRLSSVPSRSAVVRAGLATLLVSFAIHVLGPHILSALGFGTNSWAYQIKVGLKQASELSGWLLLLFGLMRLVVTAPHRGMGT